MRVLIGYSCCPLTRTAFERAGHEAWTCDILPARDGSPRHLQGDIWEFARDRWDMAIFHPMCTYLTISAAWAFNDPDYERYPGVGYHQKVAPETLVGQARREAREAREAAIANFLALMALPYPKAIENPAHSFLNKRFRKPDQIVQPYEFGDDASKATGLWLDRLPPLRKDPAKRVPGRLVERKAAMGASDKAKGCKGPKYLERWANQTDSGQNALSPSADRWLERSETYPGIANAFGEQWGAADPWADGGWLPGIAA
jgi:hypothetical protein